MPYASLRDFIDRLEKSGRLVRVTAPVSTHLEMTEIQTRLLAEKGPAVLFENVVRPDGTRSDIPVLVNLFGTVERVAWGMDREPGQLRAVGETLAFLRQPEPPGSGLRSSENRQRRHLLAGFFKVAVNAAVGGRQGHRNAHRARGRDGHALARDHGA